MYGVGGGGGSWLHLWVWQLWQALFAAKYARMDEVKIVEDSL